MPFPHPRQPGPSHCTALQQLQPAVPELLGERIAVGWAGGVLHALEWVIVYLVPDLVC